MQRINALLLSVIAGCAAFAPPTPSPRRRAVAVAAKKKFKAAGGGFRGQGKDKPALPKGEELPHMANTTAQMASFTSSPVGAWVGNVAPTYDDGEAAFELVPVEALEQGAPRSDSEVCVLAAVVEPDPGVDDAREAEGHRLGHGPEHQADPHPGCEQHGKPGHG